MQETNIATSSKTSRNHTAKQESDRNVLIYTGYAVTALLLLGAVAYHFSTQLIH